MKNKSILIVGLIFMMIIGCTSIPKYMSKEEYKALNDGLYAHMETTKGNMLIEFFEEKTPMTVANFIGLAEGKIKNDAKPLGTPYYDGIIFHRVIKDFMLQAGDPDGTGMGGPGYNFPDEFDPELKHTGKGILSMANAGPGTNGSQFFITEVETPWLDGKHSVFGKVISGLSVIDTIALVEKGAQDRPKEDVVITHVDIIRKGDKYKDYDPAKAFEDAKNNHEKRLEEQRLKKEQELKAEADRLEALKSKAETTESGLKYIIAEEGKGEKPVQGNQIKVHYTLRLANGEVIDSSYDRNMPLDVVVGKTQLIQGWMEAMTMFKRGSKVVLIIPPSLGYGENGAGGVIPPNATLFFDMEVLD